MNNDGNVKDITWLFWLLLIAGIYIAGDVFYSYMTIDQFITVE